MEEEIFDQDLWLKLLQLDKRFKKLEIWEKARKKNQKNKEI